MAQPLLTIAIPTYNRFEQIQVQVRLLLPQLNAKVQLIVYDNCSSHKVSDLFSEDELSKFRLYRNSTNIGADANIARCFEFCETKWLWTLSDDDFVKTNAVELILQYIESRSDYLFTCFLGQDDKPIHSYKLFCENLNTLQHFSGAFTMSYCLYNIDLLKPYLRFYFENITSMLGTLILVLKYGELYPQTKFCFSSVQLIDYCGPNVSWNYEKFIRQSTLFMYAFDPSNRSFYNKTLFNGYSLTNYFLVSLDRKSSNVGRFKRMILLLKIIYNQGCINAFRYNYSQIFRLFGKLALKWI